MNHTVSTTSSPAPTQTVNLELSVEEFALLRALAYRYLDGISQARDEIEDGFMHATDDLHPHWQTLVSQAAGLRDKSCLAEKVSKVFA